MNEYVRDFAYSVLNSVLRERVYDIENIVYRNVEHVARDIRHIFRAVSPLIAVRLGIEREVCKRAERNVSEIFSDYFRYIGFVDEDVFENVRYHYIVNIVLQKNLVCVREVVAYRNEISNGKFIENVYYVLDFLVVRVISEEIIEKFAYVNGADVAERRVNILAVHHPLVILVRNSEKPHNGKVIADHKVETYRVFYSV